MALIVKPANKRLLKTMGFVIGFIQTGCFAPGSHRIVFNDWGASRPCLLPLMAVKSKPPALRVVVDPVA